MSKFLVLYMAPAADMDAWMKIPEAERKEQEQKMMADWDAWTKSHAGMFKENAGAGKTKRITKEGVRDARNDVMMYSLIEAESLEAAADIFKDHPHFGIPTGWIDIMPAKDVPVQ